MKTLLHLICILAIAFSLSCCRALLGIKSPRPVSDEEILHHAKKYRIPAEDCYELDSNYLLLSMQIQQQQPPLKAKDFSQPLQARYYDAASGQLQSYHINCYADPGSLALIFSGLDWNKNGRLNSFPPLQQAPLDSLLTLSELLSYMRPLQTTRIVSSRDYDYIVVVYWNMWMGKHSRKLVRSVQKNVAKARNYRVKILYANNENVFGGHYYCKFRTEDLRKYEVDLQKLIKP